MTTARSWTLTEALHLACETRRALPDTMDAVDDKLRGHVRTITDYRLPPASLVDAALRLTDGDVRAALQALHAIHSEARATRADALWAHLEYGHSGPTPCSRREERVLRAAYRALRARAEDRLRSAEREVRALRRALRETAPC